MPKCDGAEISVWFGIHGCRAWKLVNTSDVREKMHGTYDMKTDTWKVTTAGNKEEEKTFNLLNLKGHAIENSECNSGEHPGVGTTAWQHPPSPPSKFRTHVFCRHDGIECFMWFTL